MEENKKRKVEPSTSEVAQKSKRPKQWRTPKTNQANYGPATPTIEPGDAGIWATCDIHKEGKCIAELRDLFDEYAAKLHSTEVPTAPNAKDHASGGEIDIEVEINKEVEDMKRPKLTALFQPVRVDIQCVVFIKTRDPVDPVSLVHRICSDAFDRPECKRGRWVKRLTPMIRMGKATEKGLEDLSKHVLAPYFHQEDNPPKKFAIRTTFRNHTTMKREAVIKQVADAVGAPHTVDLTRYDLLIIVEVYRNICGMSVVGNDFEKLKRYNISEIYDPTPRPV